MCNYENYNGHYHTKFPHSKLNPHLPLLSLADLILWPCFLSSNILALYW